MTPRALTPAQHRVLTWGMIAVALAIAAVLALALVRRATGAIGRIGAAKPPVITHDVIAVRLREVARLVASEMTLRDVVTYRQTRLGSTKRALLVVTARVSAGIDMERATVRIDSSARRISVTLPPAQVFGVDVISTQTYDEQAGLLNPFRPADRDMMQQQVRRQLIVSAQRSGILQHADESAARIIRTLFSVDGYTVDVGRPIQLQRPTG